MNESSIFKDKLIYQRLKISPKILADFCERNEIAELAVFGSVLRSDFNDNSDIDLLVSYKPTAKRGILEKMHLNEEFQNLFNREVDLVSKNAIQKSKNWIRRQNILDSAEIIYVA